VGSSYQTANDRHQFSSTRYSPMSTCSRPARPYRCRMYSSISRATGSTAWHLRKMAFSSGLPINYCASIPLEAEMRCVGRGHATAVSSCSEGPFVSYPTPAPAPLPRRHSKYERYI